ncbi:MAG: aspartate kinase [Bryobacterales bacterium]|nr:aspartate kinase [Bryobacterales bacterium]
MTRPVLVVKFGGTSVGSPESMDRAVGLITAEAQNSSVVVVVSAMSQVTNMLFDALAAGSEGNRSTLERRLDEIRTKHMHACNELLPPGCRGQVIERMEGVLDEFGRIARGMLLLRERPPRSVDEAASTGERLSALLVSEVLNVRGTPSQFVSGADLIVTDAAHGGATPFIDETAINAETRLTPLLSQGIVPIITGYNGATRGGVATTLGRGGSDFSAAILAAALGADELWIWTDVDGILSCDPAISADARLLADVTYNEAAELAYNGAKVLHPRTLAPLAEKEIPVRIKNSFDPDRSGTRISAEPAGEPGVRAITSLAGVVLISIEAADPSMSGAQLMARALQAAARAKVEVLLLSRSSFRQNFCMLVHSRAVDSVLENLRDELALELVHGYVHPINVDHSVGLLAAVGEGMRGTPGLAGRLFTAISRENVNIIAIAQGSSELTIAIVVNQADLRTAVSAIHKECGLGEPTRSSAQAQAGRGVPS